MQIALCCQYSDQRSDQQGQALQVPLCFAKGTMELSMLQTRCSSTCNALATHPAICWLLRTAIRRLQCWRQAQFCTQYISIKFRNGNTQREAAKYQNR